MQVIITDPQQAFDSTNISLTESLYASGTTYNTGDRVYWYAPVNTSQSDLGATFVFESLQGSNTGNDPNTSPTFWAKVGPTNRWAMRDSYSGVWTENNGNIVVTMTAGAAPANIAVRSFGLAFCVGQSITVNITAADSMDVWDGSAWQNTAFSAPTPIVETLDNETVATTEAAWIQYFKAYSDEYAKGWTLTRLITFDNVYYNPTFTITITQGSAYRAVCGVVKFGYGARLGDTEWGVSVGIKDYSRKEVNDFGVVEFVRRPYAPTISATVEAVEAAVDQFVTALGTWRAVPGFWDFNPDDATDPYEALIIYGYYTNAEIEFVDVEHRRLTLDIEGVI